MELSERLERGNINAEGEMLFWIRRREEPVEQAQIEAEAQALIYSLGLAAYSEARAREREANSRAMAKYWRRVALTISRKTLLRISGYVNRDA